MPSVVYWNVSVVFLGVPCTNPTLICIPNHIIRKLSSFLSYIPDLDGVVVLILVPIVDF